MRAPRSALAAALAAAAVACHGTSTAPPARVWIGQRDEPVVLAVSTWGGQLSQAAAAPAIDGPVRALLRRTDGNVVALQDIAAGAPPAVLLSAFGERIMAFAALDGSGAALFHPDAPPWAAAEAPDGATWVTGGLAPVRYAADGSFVGLAEPAPAPTRGIAALPDGRMAIAYGVGRVALYQAAGSLSGLLSPAFGAEYSGIDALAARPDGTLLVATLRHGLVLEGVVVAVRIDEGASSLVPVADPEASARFLAWTPSALQLAGGGIVVGPSLGAGPPACAEWLSADLTERGGCLVAGAQRGVTLAP